MLIENEVTDALYLLRAGKIKQAEIVLEALLVTIKTRRNSNENKVFTDEYRVPEGA
jgi:hypothetical protein